MSRQLTLRLDLSPSRGFAALIVAVHAAAAGCVAATVPGIAGGIVAALLLGLGIATARDRALLRHPDSVRALVIEGPQAVRLVTAGGREIAVHVATRRHVTGLAVIISIPRAMRRTVIVTRGMLDVNSFRKLRLWALWGRVQGVAPEQLAA